MLTTMDRKRVTWKLLQQRQPILIQQRKSYIQLSIKISSVILCWDGRSAFSIMQILTNYSTENSNLINNIWSQCPYKIILIYSQKCEFCVDLMRWYNEVRGLQYVNDIRGGGLIRCPASQLLLSFLYSCLGELWHIMF